MFYSNSILFKTFSNDHEMNFLSNLVDCCKTKSNLNTVWQMFGKSILFKAWIHSNQQQQKRGKELNETNAVNDRVRRAFMSNK